MPSLYVIATTIIFAAGLLLIFASGVSGALAMERRGTKDEDPFFWACVITLFLGVIVTAFSCARFLEGDPTQVVSLLRGFIQITVGGLLILIILFVCLVATGTEKKKPDDEKQKGKN